MHGEHDAKIDFASYVKETLGWECIPVLGYDEYELSEITSLTSTKPEGEFVSDRQIQEVRSRIARIHDSLESVLYDTSMAMYGDLTPRLLAIKIQLQNGGRAESRVDHRAEREPATMSCR